MCVCVSLACFIEFSCQNVTKTALAALSMQPLAKRDVMMVLRDTDYPYKVEDGFLQTVLTVT